MEMKRRGFLKSLGILGLGCMSSLCNCSKASLPSKPNFVLIMVDDLGYGGVGCYGSKHVKTPNIDEMALKGLKFTQAYSGCTVCAPSRSVLMTGKHMGHTSVRANSGGVPLLDKDVTLAEVLKNAGYATGGFGKWGLGDIRTTGAAEKQGFDTFYGYYDQVHAHHYFPDYLIHNGDKDPLPENGTFYKGDTPSGAYPAVDPETGKERTYSHYLIKEKTFEFIRKHKDQPFFCFAPWTPPHGDYRILENEPAWQMYRDKDWPIRAKLIASMTTMIDQDVKELLQLLESLGIHDNTLVIFCSDNGFPEIGPLDLNGPFRGGKSTYYEGGIRVPMIAYWPGKVPAGQTSDYVWYFTDFMPTLAELAGADQFLPPDIDGISIVPTLLPGIVKDKQKEHNFLYWEWQRFRNEGAAGGFIRAARMGQWKAVMPEKGAPYELYDLEQDPGETTDIAHNYPDVLNKMIDYMNEAHIDARPQEPEPLGWDFR